MTPPIGQRDVTFANRASVCDHRHYSTFFFEKRCARDWSAYACTFCREFAKKKIILLPYSLLLRVVFFAFSQFFLGFSYSKSVGVCSKCYRIDNARYSCPTLRRRMMSIRMHTTAYAQYMCMIHTTVFISFFRTRILIIRLQMDADTWHAHAHCMRMLSLRMQIVSVGSWVYFQNFSIKFEKIIFNIILVAKYPNHADSIEWC